MYGACGQTKTTNKAEQTPQPPQSVRGGGVCAQKNVEGRLNARTGQSFREGLDTVRQEATFLAKRSRGSRSKAQGNGKSTVGGNFMCSIVLTRQDRR